MIATLQETKAKLSQMVKLAANGKEIFITVHGKQLAKLARLRRKCSTGRVTMTAQEIQDEDRAERF
jgi:antitoxin (DNA-binding transcriptional repressor) of toxin-antitoxin stability system